MELIGGVEVLAAMQREVSNVLRKRSNGKSFKLHMVRKEGEEVTKEVIEGHVKRKFCEMDCEV
jgi:hypothetical protein